MLDENGFRSKSYQELVEEMSVKSKELFGADIQTTNHSVLGIILRIVAWFMSITYELAERVYHSGFLSQATGVSLDRLGANNGISRNAATVSIVELSFNGKPGYIIQEGVRFSTENKIEFEMIDVVTISSDGTGVGTAVSIESNAKGNVPANSIVVQVEPTEELVSVTNPSKAEGGSEAESDKDYRERIKLSIKGNPGPPINGIMTALHGVSGVRTASVIENKTMEIDSYGNPPKSVHAYILGGSQIDIGKALFESVAAGIETVGNVSIDVADIGGFMHTVNFDYAHAVTIFVEVKLKTNERYEVDGNSKVIEAVLSYINSLSMGESVRFSYIYPELYKIPGIVVADVKIGKTVSSVSSADIVLGPNESSQCITENVVINHEI